MGEQGGLKKANEIESSAGRANFIADFVKAISMRDTKGCTVCAIGKRGGEDDSELTRDEGREDAEGKDL